jgi:putative pyrroloquinoline-quinone binding quinoprotein
MDQQNFALSGLFQAERDECHATIDDSELHGYLTSEPSELADRDVFMDGSEPTGDVQGTPVVDRTTDDTSLQRVLFRRIPYGILCVRGFVEDEDLLSRSSLELIETLNDGFRPADDLDHRWGARVLGRSCFFRKLRDHESSSFKFLATLRKQDLQSDLGRSGHVARTATGGACEQPPILERPKAVCGLRTRHTCEVGQGSRGAPRVVQQGSVEGFLGRGYSERLKHATQESIGRRLSSERNSRHGANTSPSRKEWGSSAEKPNPMIQRPDHLETTSAPKEDSLRSARPHPHVHSTMLSLASVGLILVLAASASFAVTPGSSGVSLADRQSCLDLERPPATAPRLSWSARCESDAAPRISPAGRGPRSDGVSFSRGPAPTGYASVWDNPNGHLSPGYGFDYPTDMAVSPDGKSSYVTGYTWHGPSDMDFASVTVAFDAQGRTLWVSKEDGEFERFDAATGIAVSPQGDRVFVTGIKDYRITGPDGYAGNIQTIAYDAATGDRLWAAAYDGPGNGDMLDSPSEIVVSANGLEVFVAGESQVTATVGASYDSKIVTVAYSAEDGARNWAAESQDAGNSNRPQGLVADPLGRYVFVTGGPWDSAPTTVAYHTGQAQGPAGTVAWSVKDPGASIPRGVNDPSSAVVDIVADPGGSAVYVLGSASQVDSGWVVSRYDAVSGQAKVVSSYHIKPTEILARGRGLAISPDGSKLYTTGLVQQSRPMDLNAANQNIDQRVQAVSSATGEVSWEALLDLSTTDIPASVAISPDGKHIFVPGRTGTGLTIRAGSDETATSVPAGQQIWGWDGQPAVIRSSNGYSATVTSYSAETGVEEWAGAWNFAPQAGGFDQSFQALSVALSPSGNRLFVHGAGSLTSGTDGLLLTGDRTTRSVSIPAALPTQGNTLDFLLMIVDLA